MSPPREPDGNPGTPAIANLVPAIVEDVSSTRARVRIYGRAGAGVTTTLYQTAIALREAGRTPVLVNGADGVDSAATALVDIVDELGLDSAQFANIDIAFEAKVSALVTELEQRADQVVLLLDEPSRWSEEDGEVPAASADHGRMLIHRLIQASPVPVVFTGPRLPNVWVESERRLESSFDIAPLLESLEVGPLHDSARALRSELATTNTTLTGATVRLALIVHALQGSDMGARRRLIRDVRRDSLTLYDLSRLLQQQVERVDQPGQLDRVAIADAWDLFSVLRTPISRAVRDALLDAAGATGATADVVLAGLLFEREDGRWDMHEQVRRTREPYLASTPWSHRERIHETVASAYQQTLVDVPSEGEQHEHVLRAGMEAYFHLVHTHVTPELLGVSAYFADQLKLHARERSLVGQREWREADGSLTDPACRAFEQAAELFDAADRHEPDNSYIVHYRGFNRDWLGTYPDEVLADYERAIELAPSTVWWHSRLCTHLLARGRRADARRRWALAIENCTESDDVDLAKHLHRWVLRWTLEFADLDFAHDVLDVVVTTDLPDDVRTQFAAMRRWYDRLVAGATDRDVLPMGWSVEQLGVRPMLLGERSVDRWTNARIQTVEPGLLVLRCAGPFTRGVVPDSIPFDSTTFPIDVVVAASEDEVSAADLVPGRFLELGDRSDDGALVVRVFDDAAWRPGGVPPLAPGPFRYGSTWTRSAESGA